MHRNVTHRNTYRSRRQSKLAITKNFYEIRQWEKNQLVCGIDEVGRGCLAGPLVVSAVILYPNRLKLLKDSKLLSAKELKKNYPKIIKNSWHSFAIVNNFDIDKYNIWRATLMAMKQSVINLLAICPQLPSIILVDAMPLSLANTGYDNIEIKSFPKAESLSCSVAAASILAKVKRDNLMKIYDQHLPGYNFTKHKGYGTIDHQQCLEQNGQSILHRKSFLKNFYTKRIEDEQINIFNKSSSSNDEFET